MKAFFLLADSNQLDMMEYTAEKLKEHTRDRTDIGVISHYFTKPDDAPEWWRPCYQLPKDLLHLLTTGDFSQVAYIDNDIEIVGDPLSIFQDPYRIWAALDPPQMNRGPDKDWHYNSGVLVVSKETQDIVEKWEVACKTYHKKGDQDALNSVFRGIFRSQMGHRIGTLDQKFNWMRLMGDPPADCVFRHWTGPDGKRHFRQTVMRD